MPARALLVIGFVVDQRAASAIGAMLAWASLALFSARLAPVLR
jgi:hypothetical protein